MTIGNFLKKRKAGFIRGLEHAEAYAAKTLEILHFDCGLLTVLQENQEVDNDGPCRKKIKRNSLKYVERYNEYNKSRNDDIYEQGYVENGHDVFESVVLSPYDEILIWLDEVALRAKEGVLNEEEKIVINQFINELLSSRDKDFKDRVQTNLENTGLEDLLATVDLRPVENVSNSNKDVCGFYMVDEEDLEGMEAETEETREDTEEIEMATEAAVDQSVFVFLHEMLKEEKKIPPAYKELVDALQKSGLGANLMEKLGEPRKEETNSTIEDLKKQLEEALAAKSEAEAKLGLLQGETKECPEDEEKQSSPPKETFVPPPPPPMPGSCGGAVPPPPPPMPGCPPPPPPMGGLRAQRSMTLPLGLKPKKKWRNSGSFRKANWKKIAPHNMTEKAFWVKVEEESLAKTHILEDLDKKFAASPKALSAKVQDKRNSICSLKVKEAKVLDKKVAQNMSILLGGSLKQMSHEKIRKSLLECDDNVLSESIVAQLIQFVPPKEQMEKLLQFKDSFDELIEAEKFCLELSKINRLLPRLKAMQFKHQYNDMEKDSKPHIVAITAACDEVKNSKKFSKILELVLLLGNYINSGSRNESAYGFEMSFLPKLKSTKDVENKSTLLHFLVETIEKEYPELLSFYEEMPHIDQANKVSLEDIGATLKQIEGDLGVLEKEIEVYEGPQNEHDRFLEVMAGFGKAARAEIKEMQEAYKTLQELQVDLAEYFVYDKKSYTLKDLFGDIGLFKKHFLEARKEIGTKRILEERRLKARQARERAIQEKQQKELQLDSRKIETLDDCLLDVLEQTSKFSKMKRKRPHPSPEQKKPELR